METLEQIRIRLEAAIPAARLRIEANGPVPDQPSLVVDPAQAVAVARFLRDDPLLAFDYCSNVSGVDWLDRTVEERARVTRIIRGIETVVEELRKRRIPGRLEAVYHLYSMRLRQGPLILRQRTGNRADQARVASLTPVWRSAEFQEREAFDLFGIVFEGHPDLRRILMWDEFQDFPMRKDYVEPDDYEYEPTPHEDVIDKARRHYPLETGA